jgi:hypothetical protein
LPPTLSIYTDPALFKLIARICRRDFLGHLLLQPR